MAYIGQVLKGIKKREETKSSEKWILAGDAAHAMGPSAGAGMMIGLLGAWRLSWRLAQAYKGSPLTEQLLADYEREQRAGSDEIQDTNAIIFKNMAVRNSILASIRTVVLKIASSTTAPNSIAEKEALLSQVLPVKGSIDSKINGPWNALDSFGIWETGKRLPYVGATSSMLLPDRQEHTLLSIGLRAENKEREIARLFIQQS